MSTNPLPPKRIPTLLYIRGHARNPRWGSDGALSNTVHYHDINAPIWQARPMCGARVRAAEGPTQARAAGTKVCKQCVAVAARLGLVQAR